MRIFNPDFEEHGGVTYIFVAVLHEDMPFLVDSVRIELNRRGWTVHAIQNAVLAVARDGQHQLKALASPRDENAPDARESLMVIEVDRHSDPESLAKIEKQLTVHVMLEPPSAILTRCAVKSRRLFKS